MKNKLSIVIAILIIIFLLIASYFYLKTPLEITEAKAIAEIQNQFPQLKGYPSNEFPIKSIRTEKDINGWYVAFITEGSGVPIIDAQCFLIKNDKSTATIKYIPQTTIFPGTFSAKECRVIETKDNHSCVISAGYSWCEQKKKCLQPWQEPCENTNNPTCKIENCHGLDIKCGPNSPNLCTSIYQIGDKCLQYASCEVQNDKCAQVENPLFTACKSCIEKCLADNRDYMKLFECESSCN